jgi:hypothetical protein
MKENWPGGARIALNINLYIEAGGERSILEGDDWRSLTSW